MFGVRSYWLNRRNDFVGPGQPVCTFVLLYAWLWRCYLDLTQFKAIMPPPFIAAIYYDDAGCRSFALPASMERSGRLLRPSLYVWRCRLRLIQCDALISPLLPVKNFYGNGPCSLGWNDLDGPGRTGCTFVFLCSTFLIVICVGSTVWSHNLTLIRCQHILHWWWSVCVYLGWIDGTISSALDGQEVRLHSCVLHVDGVIGVRSNARS